VSQPNVTRATPADRERVIATVVGAFQADPAFRFFFPDDAAYPNQAATFAGHLFDQRVRVGTVWVAEGGASVAMWDAPSTVENAPASRLVLPPDVMDRIGAYHAAIHASLPREPGWYLGILATHPDHAGKRWGRAVMAPGLDRAATEGLPAYLETTNPRNLDLYRRAGWEILDTLTVAPVRVWTMAHYHRRVRSAFVHEATIELPPGADEAAPGGAVTVALCGHWEHEGRCRWPHHNGVDRRSGQSIRVRTVFACPPEDEDDVRQRITGALSSNHLAVDSHDDRWTTVRQGPSTIEPAEEELAARLIVY
jgi:GNAT superfamily N-acetyltransferase